MKQILFCTGFVVIIAPLCLAKIAQPNRDYLPPMKASAPRSISLPSTEYLPPVKPPGPMKNVKKPPNEYLPPFKSPAASKPQKPNLKNSPIHRIQLAPNQMNFLPNFSVQKSLPQKPAAKMPRPKMPSPKSAHPKSPNHIPMNYRSPQQKPSAQQFAYQSVSAYSGPNGVQRTHSVSSNSNPTPEPEPAHTKDENGYVYKNGNNARRRFRHRRY